jgi:hypothetical protein
MQHGDKSWEVPRVESAVSKFVLATFCSVALKLQTCVVDVLGDVEEVTKSHSASVLARPCLRKGSSHRPKNSFALSASFFSQHQA